MAVEFIRKLGNIKLPDTAPVQLGENNLNDRPSRDLFPDTVILIGPKHHPDHAIVVEIQKAKSESKLRQLPRYAAALWLFLKCPVAVLVVCPTRQAAAEYAKPITTDLAGYTHESIVVGPGDIPVLTDAGAVIDDPELAVMGVMAHGDRRSVVEAFVAGMEKMDPQVAPRYYEHAHRTAAPMVRRLLEEIMSSTSWPVSSPFAREHFGRGKEEGLKEGLKEGILEGLQEGLQEGRTREAAEILLRGVDSRGIKISDEIRGRITTCGDLEQIEAWLQRAFTAERAEDIFFPEELQP
nr:hypothetical protein [Nocardiopsis mwathae]